VAWRCYAHAHRVFEDAAGVVVVRIEQVGDVAVNEQIAGLAVGDRFSGHAAVRAAEPQHVRILAARQFAEEFGVARGGFMRPGNVGDQ